jgi:Mrp family chromosome partitioning ATPase
MGKRVGLLDIDIHGPSVPKLMRLEGERLATSHELIQPISIGDNLKVVSIGLLLDDSDNAVIWRGPRKFGVIRQFLKDVEWGDLDYLIMDSPPGTGDEPLAACQLVPNPDGALIVTTPQDVAIVDVRKAVTFCRNLGIRVLGVVENMSTLTCPHCGGKIDVFKSGGGTRMAESMGIGFAMSIPMDPSVVISGDEGRPGSLASGQSEVSKAFASLADFLGSLDTR